LGHFSIPQGALTPRPGDVVSVTVTEAKPYFLLADPSSAGDYLMRSTRAGDAWDRWQAESCGASVPTSSSGAKPVSLGMPALPVSGN
jgi:tRNA-2-methylthio-N6-dimethylallyladenosine synthase